MIVVCDVGNEETPKTGIMHRRRRRAIWTIHCDAPPPLPLSEQQTQENGELNPGADNPI